tara:strand:+ start:22435 stop:22602 length:168 start_codon:yes stop_codon:yes gene_type:complete
MDDKTRQRLIKQRARRIQTANKAKLTTKDYLQRALVVMVIALILAAALFVYNNLR